MKPAFLLLVAAAAVLGLPAAQVRSQALLPATADPMTALQNLQKANLELLKRQDVSLKDLVEMTDTAHEARIFSKRG